ncbi:MAG: lipopolysaccharide biosynthesis protein [Hyphomicrobium sp.]
MLLRQTILYLPAQVVGPVVQFVSIVLWTHFLDPSEMGVLALVTAAQEISYIVTLFWFSLYTMRYFDRAAIDDERRAFLDTEAGVMVIASGVTVAGVLALPLIIDATWNAGLIAASIGYCVSRSVASHVTDRARTAGDTITYSMLQIVWPLLGLLIGMLLVAFVSASAASVLGGYAIAQIITLAIAWARIDVGMRPQRIARDMISRAVTYGLPLVIGGAFIWVANNGLRFIVEHEQGAAAVGLVTVGWGLGLRAAGFAAMLVTAAAFPLAVAKAREHGMAAGQAQLVDNGVLLLALLAPAAAGLWVISEPLVQRIVAAPFQDMTAAVLPWAIIAGAARNLRIHFGEQVFLLREETKVPLVNDVIDGAATLLGTAIGLYAGGLQGSVVGAAIGATISLVITLACGASWHGFVVPMRHLLRIGLATAAMIAALTVFPVAPTALALGAAIILGALVYGAALAALYPDEAGEIAGKVRRRVSGA